MSVLVAAVLFGLRVVLLGALCCSNKAHRREDSLDACGIIIARGLAANLLLILLLSQCGQWTSVLDWGLWGCVSLALAVRHRAVLDRAFLSRGLAWWVITSGLVFAAMLLPVRSEWLAGGWDPGVYQNESLAIERTNGHLPERDTIYKHMTQEERTLFVRSEGSYHEVLPSLPMDLETGALERYFFPATPSVGAWFARLGGLGMLCRLGSILGLLTLPVLWSLAARLGASRQRCLLTVLMWVLIPLWWYQLAIPTSEHLQMLLLMAAMALYVDASHQETRRPWALGLILFMIVTNRFSFPALCAVILPVAAIAESLGQKAGRTQRIGFCIAALALGVLWDLNFATRTIMRLQEKDNALFLILVPFAVGSLIALFVTRLPVAKWRPNWLNALTAYGCAALAAVLGVLCFAYMNPALHKVLSDFCHASGETGALLHRVLHVSSFSGAYGIAFAMLSAAVLCVRRSEESRVLRFVVCALCAALALLIINPEVANLYPWALRRYVVYVLILVALLGGYGLSCLLETKREGGLNHARAALMGSVLVLLILPTVQVYRGALQVGDYVGLPPMLATIDAAIPDEAIVVVDDARWGTPLALMYGHDVINGGILWNINNAPDAEAMMQVLRRVAGKTQRTVVWLTSTEKGLGLYEHVAFVDPEMTDDFGTFVYDTVIHSRRADHFANAEHTRLFKLFSGF
jgi:hypothetical protein